MPGLLTLKTDLKSLKYGHDTPGGGDSGQPFIKTDINTVDSGINRLRFTRFDDGFIRGGAVGAIGSSVVDTIRISKFLTSLPRGPLFIAKQVGLQLSNPRIESTTQSTNAPTSGQGFLNNAINFVSNVANTIENAVGPTRIYNLGINTLAQVPVNALGGHIVRHGFLPNNDSSKYYYNVITKNNFQNNSNRLVNLTNKLNKGTLYNIDDYISGPSSVYGIGNTLIRRAEVKKDDGSLLFITNTNAGQPLVNDQRQAFSYIDQATFNGAVSSDLGQRNKFSEWNKTRYIGGIEYRNKGLIDVFYNITTDPNKLATAVDQSVYGSNNFTFQSLQNSKTFAGKTRSNAGNSVAIGVDFRVSNFTSSIFVSSSFPDLPTIKNPLSPLPNKIANKNDKNNPFKYETRLNYPGALGTGSKAISNYTNIETGSFIHGDIATYSDISTTPIPLTVIGNNNVSLPVVVPAQKPVADSSYAKYASIIESRRFRKLTYNIDNSEVNAFGLYGNSNNGVVGLSNGEILPDVGGDKYPIYSNGEKIVKIGLPWNKVSRELRVGSGRKDEINLTPIFSGGKYDGSDTAAGKNIRDLVKFRIQAVNTTSPENGQWMVFRAYLTDLSDSTDATWNPIKYAGRGESLYIYDSFTRKISVSFKVAALSEEESRFIYQKLNFLMSNTMPDYNNNLMAGPLIRLTVGNWVDSQLGILNSVQLKVPQDAPWEIAIDEPEGGIKKLILPHIVEVTISFTSIGSESKGANRLAEKSTTTSHIAQNNTGADSATLQYV